MNQNYLKFRNQLKTWMKITAESLGQDLTRPLTGLRYLSSNSFLLLRPENLNSFKQIISVILHYSSKIYFNKSWLVKP